VAVHNRFRRLVDAPAARTLTLGTAGTVGLNLATTVLNFVLVVVLSRLLGAQGYGAYAFALAWVAVLAVPSSLGLTPLIIRDIAAFETGGQWGHLRGLLRWSNTVVGISSVLVVGAAAIVGWALVNTQPELLNAYLVGLLLVPLFAFTTLRQSAMQGLGRVVLGRAPETIITPCLFLSLVGVAYAGDADAFDSTLAVGLNVVAAGVAFACGAYLLHRSLPVEVVSARAEYRQSAWLRSAVPLVVLSAVFALQSQLGTIVVATLADAEEAGIYSVALRVALLVGFLHLAATYPLMPAVSRLHAADEVSRIESLLRGSAMAILGLSLPVALVLFVFGEPVLAIFGAEFDGGVTTLRILVAGTAIHLVTGFAGLALMMTGHERSVAKVFVAATALTSVFTIGFVPLWGAEGAALGFVTGLLVADLLLALTAWRQLGVYLAVPPLPFRRSS